MSVRLTETAITKMAREVADVGKRRDLSDAALPGLRLRLSSSGAKSWVLACRDRLGRMRRLRWAASLKWAYRRHATPPALSAPK